MIICSEGINTDVDWVLVLEGSHLAQVKLAIAPPESAEPRIIIFFYCLITF